MLTLPYSMASPATGLEEKAATMLEKTGVIASAPHAFGALVSPYDVPADANGPLSPSFISLLQTQLQAETAKNWELSFIPRPFVKPEKQEDDDAEMTTEKLSFPHVSIPQTINPGPRPLFPEVYFSLYADQDVEV